MLGNRIDLPENYAIRFARQAVKNSLQSHGEECVLLHTYHIDEDYGTVPRCPECYDDLYEGPEKNDCPTCYGTTFKGGIKKAVRSWAIFSDATEVEEQFGKRGVFHPMARKLQTEPFPDLWDHDFVARVSFWSADHRPQDIEGIYVCGPNTEESLRTGNRPGQTTRDVVGQSAALERLAEQMPIYRYPIIGEQFDRVDGLER